MKCVSPITIGAAIALAAACGGSKASNPGGPALDAGVEAGGDAVAMEASADDGGGSDAEPPDDGPWPAAHYPMPLMNDLGGTVLTAPKIITVTFVGNPDRDAEQAFDDTFAEGTPWWTAVTNGYGIGAATAAGHYELPDTVSNMSFDDDQGQVGQLVVQWVASGALPMPDANTIYVLFFPVSTTITVQGGASCSTFGAYHDTADVPVEGGFIQASYAAIVNCPQPPATDQPMADTTDDVSHEVIEAATDPHSSAPTWLGYNVAWFRFGGSQGEVADACERSTPFTDASGNVLARAWVNAASMASSDPCQPELPGEIFYSLAVPTQVVPTQTLGLPDSDGYIVVPRGTTKTVDSVIFSEAQLPNDVQLTVGARSHGQTTLNPSIGTGITTSLTPTAGHNGMHVALTISVDMTATAKDYTAAARASLSSTDHHDWPFIVRVQ